MNLSRLRRAMNGEPRERGAAILVPLLLAATLAYWIASVPITAKVMPVTLNLLALSMLSFGNWWRLFPSAHRSRAMM